MTDLTTTHLKCLLEQATPGPWEYIPGEAIDERCIGNPGSMTMCIGVEANGAGSSCSDADLNLAAHAPELAQEVIRLRSQLTAMKRPWFAIAIDPKRDEVEQNLATYVLEHIDHILGDHDE